MHGKTILVTGGAGYLGCHLCPQLVEQGAKVRVFDRLYFGKEGLQSVVKPENMELVEGDMRAIEKFPWLLDGIYGVVHLAGLANDPSCDLSPTMAEEINHIASLKLAEMAKARGVPRFVFASSCSVYGASGEKLVSEVSPLSPVSLYAKLKIKSERALFDMADENFIVTALRQSTLFGYSPRMRFDLAINLMTLSAAAKHKIIVLGGGGQWRPFLHVKDAARAIVAVLRAEKQKIASQILNVGANRDNYTICDLAKIVEANVPDTATEVAPDDADRRSYRVRFDKIATRLGYDTTMTPADGAKEIYQAIKDGRIAEPYSDWHFNVLRLKHLVSIPVADGGETSRSSMLPYSLPTITGADRMRVADSLKAAAEGSLEGPLRNLESALLERFDRSAAMLLHSRHLVLRAALRSSGHSGPHIMIMHPFSDAKLFAAAQQLGFTPVLCDLEERSLRFDLERLNALLKKGASAIIAGSRLDMPENLKAMESIAGEEGCSLIVDAQDLMGALVNGRHIATYGDCAVLDFGPDQNVTALGGGAVLFRELSAEEEVMRGQSKNKTSGVISLDEKQMRLSPISAMLGISSLGRLDEASDLLRNLQAAYDELLSDTPHVRVLRASDESQRSGSKYPVLVDFDALTVDAEGMEKRMRDERIECHRARHCAIHLATMRHYVLDYLRRIAETGK
ncbi:NAD-dependent epimerase/dehydratase family protein, partial [bacterium]|nr:NAD-dependent epimerase/dehydratase family protein [bacterium]